MFNPACQVSEINSQRRIWAVKTVPARPFSYQHTVLKGMFTYRMLSLFFWHRSGCGEALSHCRLRLLSFIVFNVLFFFFFLLKRQEKKEQINQLKAAIFTNLRGSKDSHVDFKIRATNLSISGTSSVMLPRFLRFI